MIWYVNSASHNDNIDPDDPLYLPHETECGQFYECHAGTPVLFQCPEGTYFDVTWNVCNFNVDCGSLLTSTTAPKNTAAADEGET
ncbi:hypothetical protein NQ318_006221 [Aromia moschata]|uniref:Chitin-binding type-2 domain-containing protein n=1 Tax=Aromia moschata TaxID=1265417 RepID=A0AAV8XV35_9CUCU|nr:hypothetical protein NQ318_006221 [Aromia moschata]